MSPTAAELVLWALYAIGAGALVALIAGGLALLIDRLTHTPYDPADHLKETPPKHWTVVGRTSSRKVVLSDPCGRIVVRRQP